MEWPSPWHRHLASADRYQSVLRTAAVPEAGTTCLCPSMTSPAGRLLHRAPCRQSLVVVAPLAASTEIRKPHTCLRRGGRHLYTAHCTMSIFLLLRNRVLEPHRSANCCTTLQRFPPAEPAACRSRRQYLIEGGPSNRWASQRGCQCAPLRRPHRVSVRRLNGGLSPPLQQSSISVSQALKDVDSAIPSNDSRRAVG